MPLFVQKELKSLIVWVKRSDLPTIWGLPNQQLISKVSPSSPFTFEFQIENSAEFSFLSFNVLVIGWATDLEVGTIEEDITAFLFWVLHNLSL